MFAGKDLSAADAVLVAVAGILVVLIELAMLAVCIQVISRIIRAIESARKSKGASAVVEPAVSAQINAGTPEALPSTLSIGNLTLIDTDEPTAAVIMAIVSDMSGIELNHLNFKSIKRIGD